MCVPGLLQPQCPHVSTVTGNNHPSGITRLFSVSQCVVCIKSRQAYVVRLAPYPRGNSSTGEELGACLSGQGPGLESWLPTGQLWPRTNWTAISESGRYQPQPRAGSQEALGGQRKAEGVCWGSKRTPQCLESQLLSPQPQTPMASGSSGLISSPACCISNPARK